MDPITGIVDKDQYPQTTQVKKKDSPVEETESEISSKNKSNEDSNATNLNEIKTKLGESRPGNKPNVTDIANKSSTKTSSDWSSLEDWTASIFTAKETSSLKDTAKTLIAGGLANALIEANNNGASKDEQMALLTSKLKPIIENDLTLTPDEQQISLRTLPTLLTSLPNESKSDEAHINQTIKNIFSLEGLSKQERDGYFLEAAKTAFEGSSLSSEQKTVALENLLKAANPNVSKDELSTLINVINALPNETTKQKEIFRETINNLNGLNKDTQISNLEKNAHTIGEILDAFSKYKKHSVDDRGKQDINDKQKNLIENLLSPSFDSIDIDDDQKTLISRVISDLTMNIGDNSKTRENEIKELLNFATNVAELNLQSAGDLQDFTLNLSKRIADAYSHLSNEEQVNLASRVTGDLLQNLDIAKEYGFDKISPEKIHEGVSQIFKAMNSGSNLLENTEVQIGSLKGVNHIVSALDPKDKAKIISNLGTTLFSTDRNLSSTEKNLINIAANAASKLNESQINDLIDFGSAYLNSSAKPNIGDVFGDANILAAKLSLDANLTRDSQRTIADIAVQAFQDLAAKSGTPVNISSLKAMLSLGENGLIGNDGKLDNRDASRIANQVSHNIINNPISSEERSANYQANTQREIQHQAEVKRQARQQIPTVANQKEMEARNKLPLGGFFANGIIQRKKSVGKAEAFESANSWYPGKRGFDETTKAMNKGYADSIGQAQAEMKKGVVGQVYSEVSKALNNPSTQGSLNLLSQVLNKSSLPNYSKGTMRLDDLRSLESLKKLQDSVDLNSVSLPNLKNIVSIDKDLDINSLLGVKPDIEFQKNIKNSEHGNFDTFKDKNTNEEFYRLIDKNNETKYAIKKDDGNYAYLDGDSKSFKGKSYKTVVDTFEKTHSFELKSGSQSVEGNNGALFDFFSDKSTSQEFYRRTDAQGNVNFAIKTEDSSTKWGTLENNSGFKGRDYSTLISEFEKQNPRSQLAQLKSNEVDKVQKDPIQKLSQIENKLSTKENEAIKISRVSNGENGSKFIYFNDNSGKDFYAIKEKDGNIKLRIGTANSARIIPNDYRLDGVDYSWIIKKL